MHIPNRRASLSALIRPGYAHSQPVTIKDVPRLTAIRRVLDEVVRLHGVTLLIRRAVDLAGVRLPKGAEVAFSLYTVHRAPELYENPDPALAVEAAMRPKHPCLVDSKLIRSGGRGGSTTAGVPSCS